MNFVFIDCEYTSTHHKTTLISIGLVTYSGKELYLTLNDYDKDQVSDWVKENVMIYIDESKSISSKDACGRISEFLKDNFKSDKVSVVSAGKNLDIILMFQLWHTFYPELKYFSFERYLPENLRHRSHFDLDTMFFLLGYDPDRTSRELFVGDFGGTKKHDALYDAKIVRECFLKLEKQKFHPNWQNLQNNI